MAGGEWGWSSWADERQKTANRLFIGRGLVWGNTAVALQSHDLWTASCHMMPLASNQILTNSRPSCLSRFHSLKSLFAFFSAFQYFVIVQFCELTITSSVPADKFIAVTFLSSDLEDKGLLWVLCRPIQGKQKPLKLVAPMKKLGVFVWNVHVGLLVAVTKVAVSVSTGLPLLGVPVSTHPCPQYLCTQPCWPLKI